MGNERTEKKKKAKARQVVAPAESNPEKSSATTTTTASSTSAVESLSEAVESLAVGEGNLIVESPSKPAPASDNVAFEPKVMIDGRRANMPFALNEPMALAAKAIMDKPRDYTASQLLHFAVLAGEKTHETDAALVARRKTYLESLKNGGSPRTYADHRLEDPKPPRSPTQYDATDAEGDLCLLRNRWGFLFWHALDRVNGLTIAQPTDEDRLNTSRMQELHRALKPASEEYVRVEMEIYRLTHGRAFAGTPDEYLDKSHAELFPGECRPPPSTKGATRGGKRGGRVRK